MKQCPFCGSTNQRITGQLSYEKANNGCICITCTECQCDVYLFGNAETPYKEAVKMAVNKWNTRVKGWDEP